MNSEAVQDATDVVVDTFPINSTPAIVLFDSGASHAFISAKFVRKSQLVLKPMRNTMLINAPGGDLRATLLCPNAMMTIRG